jgi:thiamine transporter ThiT
MADPSAQKTKKTPAPQWRGMLADHHQIVRWAAIAILAAACISISFTSLGYATVTSPNAMDVHLVMLLPLVALGALLFGVKGGFLTGLFSGLVMFAHAKIMPLDAFELSFITPITSIAMMTVSGILLGFLLNRAFLSVLQAGIKPCRILVKLISIGSSVILQMS